jgi:hypothetical protein
MGGWREKEVDNALYGRDVVVLIFTSSSYLNAMARKVVDHALCSDQPGAWSSSRRFWVFLSGWTINMLERVHICLTNIARWHGFAATVCYWVRAPHASIQQYLLIWTRSDCCTGQRTTNTLNCDLRWLWCKDDCDTAGHMTEFPNRAYGYGVLDIRKRWFFETTAFSAQRDWFQWLKRRR